MNVCTIEDCGNKAAAKGLCRFHYDAARRADPVQAEKLRAYKAKYFQTDKGKEAMRRSYIKRKAA